MLINEIWWFRVGCHNGVMLQCVHVVFVVAFCTMIAMIYVEDLVLVAHNEVKHIIFCLLYVCIKL